MASSAFQRVASIVGQPDAAFLEHEGYNLALVLQTFSKKVDAVVLADSCEGVKSEAAVQKARDILCKLVENINPNMGVDIATRNKIKYTLVPSEFNIQAITPTNGMIEFQKVSRSMTAFALLNMCYQSMLPDEQETPLCDYRLMLDNGSVLSMTQTFGEHKINMAAFCVHIVSRGKIRSRLLAIRAPAQDHQPDEEMAPQTAHVLMTDPTHSMAVPEDISTVINKP